MLTRNQTEEQQRTYRDPEYALQLPKVKPFGRHAVRLGTAIKAVVCPSGILGKTCVIRDLSTSGARLEFDTGSVAEEDDFVLYVPAYKIALNCRRIWRSNEAIGVQFENGRPDLMDGLAELLRAAA